MPASPLEEDLFEISKKLTRMSKDVDRQLGGAIDLIEALEKMPVNIEVLTKTRIGMVLNDFRKKVEDEKLAKRCKALIKRWKALLEEKAAQSRSSTRSRSPDEPKHSVVEDKRMDFSSASATKSRPMNGTSFVATDVRSKSVEMLMNALKSGTLPDGTLDPEDLSKRIEKRLFDFHSGAGDKYKSALRSRVFNLRDKKNQALRENVLTGAVSAEKFATMTTEEMASEEMKKTREMFTKEGILEHQMSVQEGTPTDMFSTVKMNNRIVVCGGGLMGLSVAYSLAKRGLKEIYLFERNCIGGHNSSRLNTGLYVSPMFYSEPSLRSIARKSLNIYDELASTGTFEFNKCGRVYLSSSDETEMQAKRLLTRLSTDPSSSSQVEAVDCPSEMLARWPMLATEDVKLAVFSPLDGIIDVSGLSRILADNCREMGVKIFEDCGVKKVLLNEESRVYAVDTDEGFIDIMTFVNAAGIGSNFIDVLGLPESDHILRIAAHPCSFTFLSTDPLPHCQASSQSQPIFVCLDENTYICPLKTRTICGGFSMGGGDIQSLPPSSQTTKGTVTEWNIQAPVWDNFRVILRHLINRCPQMAQLPRGELMTSAEMYTPDMRPLIGESDQAKGFFIATGLNGQGVSFAGGLGEILAEWIMSGSSSVPLDKLELTRFLPLHSNPHYLYLRVPEVAFNTLKNPLPSHQCHTARNLRSSPIHHSLRDAGAVFAEIMGYERPLWYNTTSHLDQDIDGQRLPRQSLFSGEDQLIGKPKWFPLVSKEYSTCRERVGLIDMTSFSKFDIQGADVVPLLQRLCSGNIDCPIGTTVYTGMQNDHGGYVTDLTLSRMGLHYYFIVAPTIQQVRLALWIKHWANEWKMNVQLQDVTNAFTALDIVGPASRALMSEVTGKTMSSNEFPSFAFREMHIGLAGPIRVISVTHCGELGWMLYIPNEVAQNVYEQLIEAGGLHGFRHCGYYALRHLRIEKFYVYWGQDIGSGTTPVECGRAFRVDFDKEFIGKEALQSQLDRGVNRRFVQLLLENHNLESDPWPQGEEPIYRNGKLVGWTTTAAYGFTLGCHVNKLFF
ncbi:hypothetical protein Mgra_00002359 [Meloidogyne graminicola]|uniref:Mediator complex subunit 26 n=1 Tax=Meloidogyne graminicola TaxID=189291 RepID=A0A8S9ZWU3_9BILA|nr:hypothetical protein Mgra_00002359 [Meloidogyne graminicola]